jgi:hypothetical protein
VPTVLFVTQKFASLAGKVARGDGMPDLPVIMLPAEFEHLAAGPMRDAVAASLEAFARQLAPVPAGQR